MFMRKTRLSLNNYYKLMFLHTFFTYDISKYPHATLFNLDSKNVVTYLKHRMISIDSHLEVIEIKLLRVLFY